MSFPRYERCKDSRVEWLGEVPAHWQIAPLKYVASVTTGYAFSSADFTSDGIPVLRIGDITNEGQVDFSNAKYLSEHFQIKHHDVLVRNNDIVMAMTGATIGKVGRYQSKAPALLNQRVCIFRTRFGNIQEYLWHVLNTHFYAEHLSLTAFGGAQPNISDTQLLTCLIPIPTVLEQYAIATFLDRETAKIDALIAEQQRLIELLKEKCQAVISHAVTKGLNPDVPMKDSGIEWLGEVPEHWEILKGGQIGRIFGSEQVPEEYVCDDGELPFIKVGSLSLNDFEIASWDWYVDPIIAHQYRHTSNYIVFPKRGAAIFTNKVNIVERPSLIDPNLMGWKMSERAIAKFIAHILKSRRLSELADVSTVPQINNKHIAPERFPIPSLKEQNKIIVFLDCETAKFATLTAEAQRAITLLNERRTALISAAVTGKIDVGGLMSAQPEEAVT